MTALSEAPVVIELINCECCHWGFEPVELEPGPSGDLFCGDCLTSFHETSLFAY